MANEIIVQLGASGSIKEIFEYASVETFPYIGASGKFYVDLANNIIYRWDSTTTPGTYKELSSTSTQYTAINGNTY